MKNNSMYLLMHFTKRPQILILGIIILVLTLVTGNIQIAFASSPPPPTIGLFVSTGLGQTVFSVDTNNNGYFFTAQATWSGETSSIPGGSDIYFGILSPERDKVWTWTRNNDNETTLNDGFFPYALASTDGNFVAGDAINYIFSGNEPKGMYLLFLLLVIPGGDPSDISQWYYIGNQPFFFLDP